MRYAPAGISATSSRTTARSCRRHRFLSTAPPKRLPIEYATHTRSVVTSATNRTATGPERACRELAASAAKLALVVTGKTRRLKPTGGDALCGGEL